MAARGKKPQINWGDDALKIATAIVRKIQKGDEKAAIRVGNKVVTQMRGQGKGKAASNVSSALSRGLAAAKTQSSNARKATAKESDKRIIRKGQGVVNVQQANEGVKSKGTIYRGGREMPISRRDAANLSSRSGAARSQSARGNASQIEKGKKLKDAIDNAPNAAAKVKARRAYRAWQDKTGRR